MSGVAVVYKAMPLWLLVTKSIIVSSILIVPPYQLPESSSLLQLPCCHTPLKLLMALFCTRLLFLFWRFAPDVSPHMTNP